jgi:hypothetical protein
LVKDFKGFEETHADAIKEDVHLVNELNLGVSNEEVDELNVNYLEPMSTEDLTDIQEENKARSEAKNNECQSPPTKTMTVQEINPLPC